MHRQHAAWSAWQHAAGYENIIQLRALLEGVSTSSMLDSWHTMLSAKMQEWDLDRAAMVDLFGDTRDAWMAEDLDDWLSPNRIYDGVADAMKAAIADKEAEVYIVTTKQVCNNKLDWCGISRCSVADKFVVENGEELCCRHHSYPDAAMHSAQSCNL